MNKYRFTGHRKINNFIEFSLWAPVRRKVELHIYQPFDKIIPMKKDSQGYFTAKVECCETPFKYKYRINGRHEFPDPASFYQPDGVHECSQTYLNSEFNWQDSNFNNHRLEDYIIYELHVGTFTDDGTFFKAAEKISYLKELGINTVEIMPVAQFPGERNWGYDGVYPFAVQNSYGGPDGLKYFVNECHKNNIAVILDVVYNHLGPEGNYFSNFSWYFTSKYHTPWGDAINFDDKYSDGVRNFFINNALYFLENFHIDALRLDAIHSIYDLSANHFLKELNSECKKLSSKLEKPLYLIAESDLNDTKIIDYTDKGGYGIDSQWLDDFHHAVWAYMTGETQGYYSDFGNIEQIFQSISYGFVYRGNYSKFRKRCFGNDSSEFDGKNFVSFIQNHDQVGNRMAGDRISHNIEIHKLKLISAFYILSPYIPMIFMGEEYGEKNCFNYFVDHGDKNLLRAVSEGRKKEFREFYKKAEFKDPACKKTFESSKLNFDLIEKPFHKEIFCHYKKIIDLRKKYISYIMTGRKNINVILENNILTLKYTLDKKKLVLKFNFSGNNTIMPGWSYTLKLEE